MINKQGVTMIRRGRIVASGIVLLFKCSVILLSSDVSLIEQSWKDEQYL